MKKTKALTIFPNSGIMERLLQGGQLTPQEESTVKANLPAWIPEKENIATAMMQTGQEFLIAVEEILRTKFNFTEQDEIKLEKGLKKLLPVLHTMELKGLSVLSPRDMATVGQIAQSRRKRLEFDKQFKLPEEKKLSK